MGQPCAHQPQSTEGNRGMAIARCVRLQSINKRSISSPKHTQRSVTGGHLTVMSEIIYGATPVPKPPPHICASPLCPVSSFLTPFASFLVPFSTRAALYSESCALLPPLQSCVTTSPPCPPPSLFPSLAPVHIAGQG